MGDVSGPIPGNRSFHELKDLKNKGLIPPPPNPRLLHSFLKFFLHIELKSIVFASKHDCNQMVGCCRLRDALLEVGFRTTNEILGQILLRYKP